METTALKKVELWEKISHLPEQQFSELENYVEKVLSQSVYRKKTPQNLRGIWQGKGFEKITNIENELAEVRKELSDSILKREF